MNSAAKISICLIALNFFCGINLAQAQKEKSKHTHNHDQHREHKAHSHGKGQLGIVFEANAGVVDFEIPSESIFGFEHAAKTETDKKKVADAIDILKTKINEMIVFDSTLQCVFQAQDVKVNQHQKNHSEVEARYSVQCAKSPLGSDLTFNFHSQFKKIKKLKAQIVIEVLQKSVEIKAAQQKVTLK